MIPFLLRVVAGTAALPIALTAWIGASAAQDADDPIVATVNGQEIRRDQVLEAIQRLPQQIQANMPLEALVPAIAQQLATSWLMAERGYAENLQDSQEVKDQVAAAERRIVQNVWLDQEVAARIAEDAVDQAYQDYLAANPPSEEVRARHILVGTEDEAKDLIDQLNEGAVFADLAAEFSVGPSGPRG
ncbi:MAG: peptidylprolyl isomerase, partial [Alphaproteobacteria bacterium]